MVTRMNRVLGISAALLCAASAALSGCSSPAPVQPSSSPTALVPTVYADPTGTATPSPTTPSTAASSSASSSASGGVGDWNVNLDDLPGTVPAAVKSQDVQGATMFVWYFVDVLNRALQNPRPQIISKSVGTPRCHSCATYDEIIGDLAKAGERYAKPTWLVKSVSLDESRPQARDMVALKADVLATGAPILSRDAKVVDHDDAGPQTVYFLLRWTSRGWRAEKVEVDR